MQEAHLYQAIPLVNRGVAEAARRIERLRRATDSHVDRDTRALQDPRLGEGKPSKVRILTPRERREWEGQYPRQPDDAPGTETEANP